MWSYGDDSNVCHMVPVVIFLNMKRTAYIKKPGLSRVFNIAAAVAYSAVATAETGRSTNST